MSVRVIVPPEPIMLSNEIPGMSADDADVESMILAVVGQWDGPDGYLGRCIGPQTLEIALDCWFGRSLRLPYGPVIDIDSVVYTDPNGVDQTVDETMYGKTGDYLWLKPSWREPPLGYFPEPVRIRYEAGYNGEPADSGGTGDIPVQVKRAVILSVQYLKTLGKDDLFLRVDEVDGVGRREFTVSAQAGTIIQSAADNLLFGLRRVEA